MQDAFLKIICSKGITGLWSGLSPTLVSALPSTIIYFVTYEYLKQSFTEFIRWRNVNHRRNVSNGKITSDKSSPLAGDQKMTVPSVVPMLSGMCSRTMVVTAITPLEMVRINMQSGFFTYNELWTVLRSMVKNQGLLGLWRGWPPTVMRDAPFSGTYWATYESLKRLFSVTEPTFWFSFFSGAVSGAVGSRSRSRILL